MAEASRSSRSQAGQAAEGDERQRDIGDQRVDVRGMAMHVGMAGRVMEQIAGFDGKAFARLQDVGHARQFQADEQRTLVMAANTAPAALAVQSMPIRLSRTRSCQ